MKKFLLSWFIAVSFVLFNGSALASVVYSNTYASSVSSFGASTSSNGAYGEAITLTSAQELNYWAFYIGGLVSSGPGYVSLEITPFNTTTSIAGPSVLYYSPTPDYVSGSQILAFNNINTTLNAGTYVVFATVTQQTSNSFISNALQGAYFQTSQGNGTIGAGVYISGYQSNPVISGGAWQDVSSISALHFYATMTAVTNTVSGTTSVYGPNTVVLGLLGIFGLLLFRRKQLA